MPSTKTQDAKRTGRSNKARGQTSGTSAPDAGAGIEAEGDRLKVQGVEVDPAGSIPTGIPLPDGGTFLIVKPGTFAHDPEIDSGRDAEDYAESKQHMQELRDSMKAFAARNSQGIGNENAVICRPGPDGVPVIVHGRRRDAAAGFAGTMLAVIVRPMTTREARISATVENTQREDVSVLGEARQYHDLRAKEGMKVEEIAAAVGQQQAYVSKRLALLNLPAWAQAMLRTGELTEGTAYEGMARFVRVPEPAGSEMWATLHRRWPEIKAGGVTAERIRSALGQIARNLSRSLDPSVSYTGEAAPLFDLAAHDAVCNCKRPKVRLHDTLKEHARCYDVAKWDKLQEDARAERRRALQGNGSGTGNGSSTRTAQEGGTDATTPTESKPLPPVPDAAARYAVPTWAEAEEAIGPAARDHILTNDFTAAEINSAPPCKVLDVSALSPETVRIVQAPRPGLFRVVCIDAAALKRATVGAERAVKARAERIQQQERNAFREVVAKVELRAPEVLAVLAYGYGNAPGNFGISTASLLGLDVRGDLSSLAALPKKELTLWLQAIAYRMQKQDTSYRNEDRTAEARDACWTECAEDFRALLSAVPAPELTTAGRLQARAGRIAALWEDVAGLVARSEGEAGAFADEMDEYGPAWAAQVAAFRAECNGLAAEGVAFGLDLDGVTNPHGDGSLADLIGDAARLLQHPVYARIEAAAARPASEQASEDGEGAQAPAPVPESEQVAEDGEGPQAPAPEPEREQAAEDGEGAQAPAPEPESEQVAENGEGAQAPATDPADGGPNVIRVPGGTHTVRGGGRRKGRK